MKIFGEVNELNERNLSSSDWILFMVKFNAHLQSTFGQPLLRMSDEEIAKKLELSST